MSRDEQGCSAAPGGGTAAKDVSSHSRVWLTVEASGRPSLHKAQEVQAGARKPRELQRPQLQLVWQGWGTVGWPAVGVGEAVAQLHTSPSYRASLGCAGAKIPSPGWACPVNSRYGLWVGETSSLCLFPCLWKTSRLTWKG